MTKSDLIRTILETCTTPRRPHGSGAGRLATRSPAAGGGLAAPSPGAGRRALRDPQTGDLLVPTAAGARRRR